MISTSKQGVEVVKEKIKNDYFVVTASSVEEVTDKMIGDMKANRDKVLVIGTGDKAPDSKVALYILKRFGIDRLLVETPSYMH